MRRRDLLTFLGGSAAGALLTPVPWKLLDDTAIWSQNWAWVPRVPRGPVRTRFTHCTLCPAGCAMRARCAGQYAVSLAGVAGHPVSRGALCPIGVGAHHLPFHPGRIRQVLKRGHPAPAKAAFEEIAGFAKRAAAEGRSVAVLDSRPGRAMSLLYRKFAAGQRGGVYIPAPSPEEGTVRTAERIIEGPGGPLGIDLERVKTLLSFGAPVLDGWATPGRVMERRDEFHLIQVEPVQSRTAALAETWLPLKPGTEAVLALGLGHLLVQNEGVAARTARAALDFAEYRQLVAGYPPERVAEATGIAPEAIRATSLELAENGPALVVAGGDSGSGRLGRNEQLMVAGLNLLLGGLGKILTPRRELPVPKSAGEVADPVDISDVPDGGIGLLIVDATGSCDALAWTVLERKLAARDRMVVTLASLPDGYGDHADYVIPTPAWLESMEDVPPCWDAKAASFGIAAALEPPPEGTIHPIELLRSLGAAVPGSLAECIKERVEAIFAARRGSLFRYEDGGTTPLADIESADKLQEALAAGACWIDSETPVRQAVRFSLCGGVQPDRLARAAEARRPADLGSRFPVTVLPHGWRAATGAVPPLLTKLYQESALRPSGEEGFIHPKTGQACGLKDGERAVVQTDCGTCTVKARFDDAIMPGVMQVAVGPETGDRENQRPGGKILEICEPDGECTWRVAQARVWKA